MGEHLEMRRGRYGVMNSIDGLRGWTELNPFTNVGTDECKQHTYRRHNDVHECRHCSDGLRANQVKNRRKRYAKGRYDGLDECPSWRNQTDKQPTQEPHRNRNQHSVASFKVEQRDHVGQSHHQRSRQDCLHKQCNQKPAYVEPFLLVATL